MRLRVPYIKSVGMLGIAGIQARPNTRSVQSTK